MRTSAKIALRMPYTDNPDKYFSIKLKYELYNEPSEFTKQHKILAISDIEGNFLHFVHLLVKAGVIDNKLRWTFGSGHLVIVGDCFDRGEQVVECLWLIYSLEEKARKRGGYVHFILGNHEIMNLNGDWRYVHPKYAKTKETSKTPSTALYDANNEIWRWLQTKNIVEKIGDILFVHGGISEEILQLDLGIDDINRRARKYYSRINDINDDRFLSIVFASDQSPFWYRGYYQPGTNENLINETLLKFDVTKIITGHTITDTIKSYYNGKVINLDTDHAIGNSEALLIKNKFFFKVKMHGKIEKII